MRNRLVAVTVLTVALAFAPGCAVVDLATATPGSGPHGGVSAERPVSVPRSVAALGQQSTPAAAWDGTAFLVVWLDARNPGHNDIVGARVSASGEVLDPGGIVITSSASAGPGSPAVAWNGTCFLVVWHDFRNATPGSADSDIFGARVSAGGVVLDRPDIPIATSGALLRPTVAANGGTFLVAWETFGAGPSRIRATRMNGAGTVLDPNGIAVSGAPGGQFDPAAAPSGAGFLVVWADNAAPHTDGDIHGARVDAGGVVLDPSGILIATGPNQQRQPKVAWNGATSLVVWSEFRPEDGTNDVYAARVDAAGTVLDQPGRLVSNAASSQEEPAVAATGSQFLVAWDDFRRGPDADVFGSRVSAAGAALDPAGIVIATGPGSRGNPVVTSGGTGALVSWQDTRLSLADDIFAARVTGATVADPDGILVSRAAAEQRSSTVAFDGEHFFVVWSEWTGSSLGVFGARLTRDGRMLDPAGIPIGTATSSGFTPAVSWNGSMFLVVWEQDAQIFGARVARNGTVLDRPPLRVSPLPSPIGGLPARALAPDVVWNRTAFLVVWTRIAQLHGFFTGDVLGARVSAAGTVLDPGAIGISSSGDADPDAKVASNGTSALVVWSVKGDVHGARVGPGGVVLAGSPIVVSAAANGQSAPDVASDGHGFEVVWVDTRNGPTGDIYAARVAANGGVVDLAGVAVSTATGAQTQPSIAFDDRYLVVWRDERNGPAGDVYGARIARGAVLDPLGIAISVTGTGQHSPAVSAGPGDAFGVTYDRFVPRTGFNTDRVFLRVVATRHR